MNINKFLTFGAAMLLIGATFLHTVQARPAATTVSAAVSSTAAAILTDDPIRVRVPLNLAILVQDDLVSRVGNELDGIRSFTRALPGGSRVMIGYIRSGSLQIRQPFTTDLDRAAEALRIPVGSVSVSPYNPYVQVIEALRRFETAGENRNAILLISDGLDVSRGFDWSSSVNSIDLQRAIRKARERDVAVYSFYAPTAGLTTWNRTAISFGQSALNRLANETGGRAFFQGTSFVTFSSYFDNLSRTLNQQVVLE